MWNGHRENGHEIKRGDYKGCGKGKGGEEVQKGKCDHMYQKVEKQIFTLS